MAENKMDFMRQLDLLDPSKFCSEIHVVGVGATGSYIALAVAKTTGSPNVHVWDFDKVEAHNLPNQLFGPEDVGKLKTEALSEHLLRHTGVEVTQHGKCDETSDLGGVVFLCVDGMDTRKSLWDALIKNNPKVILMVEMRLGIEMGVIFTINPCDPEDIACWESAWYPDSEAEDSPCTNRMISTTVMSIAGRCAHRLIHHYQKRKVPRRVSVSLDVDLIIARNGSNNVESPEEELSVVAG